MKVRTIDEAFETPAQRARRLVETYARRGWGIDDIQTALKREPTSALAAMLSAPLFGP